MKILVYDIAASESGALGVLEEHYLHALQDKDNEYVFVVSTPEFDDADNVKILRFPEVKSSWAARLKFDYLSARAIVEEENPDKVLSLQNMGIPGVSVPQTVYEHNCLFRPFTDYRFSFFKEKNLWIRQNIIGQMTIRSLKQADEVIVQTSWMKRRCVEKLGIAPEKIEVKHPVLSNVPTEQYRSKEPLQFIYPSTGLKYKNHAVIVEACKLIPADIADRMRILFTLKSVNDIESDVEIGDGPIDFIGWQTRDDLYKRYSECCLLFTSELESFPLPLFEASVVGCPIVVPSLEYAHEILDDYDNVFYYQQNNAESLAAAILDVFNKYAFS